jgi:hypothetical protein
MLSPILDSLFKQQVAPHIMDLNTFKFQYIYNLIANFAIKYELFSPYLFEFKALFFDIKQPQTLIGYVQLTDNNKGFLRVYSETHPKMKYGRKFTFELSSDHQIILKKSSYNKHF